jgi:hypothetical protein
MSFLVVDLLSGRACGFAVSRAKCQIPLQSVARVSFVSVFVLLHINLMKETLATDCNGIWHFARYTANPHARPLRRSTMRKDIHPHPRYRTNKLWTYNLADATLRGEWLQTLRFTHPCGRQYTTKKTGKQQAITNPPPPQAMVYTPHNPELIITEQL